MQANESLLITRQLIGREQQCAQLATHHVCLRTQRGIPPQYLAGQSSILLADTAGSMVTSQGLVQALRQAVVVQMGINVLALRIQLDQLVLTRLHLEQGYPHAIQYACHHLLMTWSIRSRNRTWKGAVFTTVRLESNSRGDSPPMEGFTKRQSIIEYTFHNGTWSCTRGP